MSTPSDQLAEAIALTTAARLKSENGTNEIALALQLIKAAEQKLMAAKFNLENAIATDMRKTVAAIMNRTTALGDPTQGGAS